MSSPVDAWLSELVNTARFQRAIEADIEQLEEPAARLRARLELLSYVAPKVKGVDPLSPDQTLDNIEIKYVEAKPPKKLK